jgi:hypothetical protein
MGAQQAVPLGQPGQPMQQGGAPFQPPPIAQMGAQQPTPIAGADPTKTFSQNMMTGMGRGSQGKQFTTLEGKTFTPYSKINLDLWQGQNAAIDKLVPLLKQLKETMKGKTALGFAINPVARAKKEDIASKAVEKILKAQGLTSTEKGIQVALNQLEPFAGEPNDAYLERLQNSINEYGRQRDQNLIKIRQAGTRTGKESGLPKTKYTKKWTYDPSTQTFKGDS